MSDTEVVTSALVASMGCLQCNVAFTRTCKIDSINGNARTLLLALRPGGYNPSHPIADGCICTCVSCIFLSYLRIYAPMDTTPPFQLQMRPTGCCPMSTTTATKCKAMDVNTKANICESNNLLVHR